MSEWVMEEELEYLELLELYEEARTKLDSLYPRSKVQAIWLWPTLNGNPHSWNRWLEQHNVLQLLESETDRRKY